MQNNLNFSMFFVFAFGYEMHDYLFCNKANDCWQNVPPKVTTQNFINFNYT